MIRLFLCCAFLAALPPASARTVIVISLDGFPAYALDDPNLPVPTLRKLIAEGATAHRMTPVNPTITWPNHTAMVTGVDAGRNGLLVNGKIERTGKWPPVKVNEWTPKTELVKAPTVYDIAFQAGLTTAEVDWVAIANAPSITWSFPEIPSSQGKIERAMIAAGRIDAASVDNFTKANIVWRDQAWTDAAAYILMEHKPNLLLFHVLTLDSVHHGYGPKSLAASAAMAFLDSCVARIVGAVREAGLTDSTTLFVVSDHGFKRVDKQIHLNAMLNEAHLGNRVFALPEGGLALIYLESKARAVLPDVPQALQAIEGVERVLRPSDYAALGLPSPEHDSQMSDFVAIAKPGYAFSGGNSAAVITAEACPTGSHGYLRSDPDMDAIFIAWGAGIRAGAVLSRVRNVDLAPTIASLLGIQMPPGIQGRRINAILK